MGEFSTIFAVLSCLSIGAPSQELHPLSDEFIDLTNSNNSTWTAGRNFPPDTPLSYIENLLGLLELGTACTSSLPVVTFSDEFISSLPEQFDPREKWPNCPSLSEIRDQGSCGSCWVFGAVEAMTDRYCIFSNGTQQFHFSAQDLLTCCSTCGGCNGGIMELAWEYWKEDGIASGGNYNSNEGCKPYEIEACEHHTNGSLPPCTEIVPTPQCVYSCREGSDINYNQDKRHGKRVYQVPSSEDQIKAELIQYGPVEAGFLVYEDFLTYKSGVYQYLHGKVLGGHAVKILGWGVENGVKYWLVANSWNNHWGDSGYFKFLRGENHCGIEESIIAGEPDIL